MKEQILEYLKKRRDYMMGMVKESFDDSGEVNCCVFEVYLTYNAIISDIKNERFGV